jgi:predicted ATPase
MFIQRIQAAGLLSFGPEGIDLPLQRLNVLIGPNASGKSNLIELISLVQATSRDVPLPPKGTGGEPGWLWRGETPAAEGTLEVIVSGPDQLTPLRHRLGFQQQHQQLLVVAETIEDEPAYEGAEQARQYRLLPYAPRHGSGALIERVGTCVGEPSGTPMVLEIAHLSLERSILSQVRDPDRFAMFAAFQKFYDAIRLYQNWFFGPRSPLRRPQVAAGPALVVEEDLSNYQRVIWNLRREQEPQLLEYLGLLYEGISNLHLDQLGDTALLSLKEAQAGYMPVSRLSDGTVRYLCLLAILLSPTPPPLIVIDEPDLGLHPDLMPTLARLLTFASERTQVLVTTHSRALVDAFTDRPETVVVCERDEMGTRFDRLDSEELSDWLQRYSLGQLWSRGDIGGNRW